MNQVATVSVRVARPSDADAMARLHHESHIKSFAAFVPDEWVNTRDLDAYRAQIFFMAGL